MEKYIFDIPIYRCDIDKHTHESENEKKKYQSLVVDAHGEEAIGSDSYLRMGERFDRDHWYPWQFNEIIGYIRIYAIGYHVKGELWLTRAKKIRRDLKNKKIFYRGKAFEHRCFYQSSEDIFNSIQSEIVAIQNQQEFKKRFVDLSQFLEIGPFIDWPGLLAAG
ncbi:MAG: hypothetical protein D3918_13430 [Candidatus Electrothrix sp. AX2]|nr:hypothetical protein [Candidatus Electrothrix gigas]